MEQIKEAQNPKLAQLKIIPEGATEFVSEKSGMRYFVEYNINEIMLRRYEVLEKFLLEMNFSMTAEHLTKNIFNAMNMLKQGESNDAYVILHNIIQGITDSRTKHIITMWVCSVFIYRQDEDISTWDKATANEKIEDWKDNFNTGFFLQLRNKMFSDLENSWNIISQAFSEFPVNPMESELRQEEMKKKYGENQKNEP